MNHFRNYLNINEYCLYYTFQDETGLTKIKTDMNNFKELREYSKKIQGGINKKIKEINTILGHRKAEHFFYHSSTQWELCTEETYNELIEKFEINKLIFRATLRLPDRRRKRRICLLFLLICDYSIPLPRLRRANRNYLSPHR